MPTKLKPEIYHNGKVKLYFGNPLDVMRSMEPKSIDFVVFDPPPQGSDLRQLIKTMTPKGGTVLDPRATNAAAAEAAWSEERSSVLIVEDKERLNDIRRRILRLGSGD